MPGDYAVLAPVYDITGMSDYVRRMTPHLMDYAQHTDWLGRRILVLGCGTGASIEYLSNYPYAITGIDNSPEMLAIARQKLADPGLNIKWQQQDIREIGAQITAVDLVLALNVFNEMNNLRDLETAFTGVQKALDTGKLFLFDMMTVQGLTEDGLSGNKMLYDDPQALTVFTLKDFDYERQMETIQYLIFRQQGNLWQRSEAKRVLRAFPTQAIASLLQRSGFNMRAILNADLDITNRVCPARHASSLWRKAVNMMNLTLDNRTGENPDSLSIPVDREHGWLRFAIVIVFIVLWIIGFSISNAIIPSAGFDIIAGIIGLLVAALGGRLIEPMLKARWPSGRAVTIDQQGIRLTTHGHIQVDVRPNEPASILFWRFKVKRRGRVQKGWYVIACAIEQDDNFLPIYTFASPEQTDAMNTNGRFVELLGEKALKNVKKDSLRVAGEQRRLHLAEAHRWNDGAEMILRRLRAAYLERLNRQFPQWIP